MAAPNALRVWLRQVVPVSPVNHSQLVVTSEAIKGFLQTTPLKAALDAEVGWVSGMCADYVAAMGAAAAPYTVFTLPQGILTTVDGLASSLGQDRTGLLYLAALLAAYPLGAFLALLPGRHLKSAFSALAGLFLAQVVFPSGWAHAAVSSAVAYAFLAAAHGLRRLTGVSLLARWAHVAVFVWMMGYMCVVHLYRLHTDYMGWSLDFSGPQMLLTIKLSSLAYNLYDGTVQRSYYEKAIKDGHSMSKIFADRLGRSVSSLPDPLAFAGYVFCFTAFFAGPAFEYAEYARSVAEERFQPTGDKQWGSRIKASLRKLLVGLAFLGAHLVGGAIFNFESVISRDMLHGPATSLLFRFGYALITLFFVRTKYYFAWLVSEGSSNLAGFGYSAGTWDGVSNMDVLGFELANSATSASKAWNKNTQSWLARYCNQRLPKGINMWATYALSAFWHGFYPGYYLFFMSAPLLQTLEKDLGAKVYPRVQASGPLVRGAYGLLSRLAVPIGLNYLVMPFVALGWDYGITAWASLYFSGHLIILAVVVLLALIPPVTRAEGGGTAAKKAKAQ